MFSSWGIWARSILFHIILSHGLHLSISISLRAIASIDAKFFPFCTSKTYFFYFTLLFLQNTHISLSIIHLYSNKIFIFLLFFIIFFTASLSLLDPTTIIITTWLANHSRSNQPKIRNPFRPKPTQSESQIITHQTRNPLIKQWEISELIGDDLIRLCAALVWCWSVAVVWSWLASWSTAMVWSWSNEKNGEWSAAIWLGGVWFDADRQQLCVDQMSSSCGSGVMLIMESEARGRVRWEQQRQRERNNY